MISSNIVIATACITIAVMVVSATVTLSQIMSLFRLSIENNTRQVSTDVIEGELDVAVNPDQQLMLSMVVDSNDRIRELQNQVGGLERMVMIMGSTCETGNPTDGSVHGLDSETTTPHDTNIEDDVEMTESEMATKQLDRDCKMGSDVKPKYTIGFKGPDSTNNILPPLYGKVHVQHDNSELVELLKKVTDVKNALNEGGLEPAPTIQNDPKNVKSEEDSEGGTIAIPDFVEENLSKDCNIRPRRESTPERLSDAPPKKEGEEVQRDSMGRPIISADSIMKKARR